MGPDQALNFVGPDEGPNCLLGLSADNRMSGWIEVQTVCKGYQHADNKSGQRVKYMDVIMTQLVPVESVM